MPNELEQDVVRVGDLMRFSAQLLKQIAESDPDPVLVRLQRVITADDGTKVLVLERAQ